MFGKKWLYGVMVAAVAVAVLSLSLSVGAAGAGKTRHVLIIGIDGHAICDTHFPGSNACIKICWLCMT